MPILAILAIVFFSMTVGSLLVIGFLEFALPDFVTTKKAALALKIIGNTLLGMFYVGFAALIITGIVAVCVFFPC